MRIRARRENDLPRLAALADAVRVVDRWPPHRVGSTRHFIASAGTLAAFVAEHDGAVIGQVALHERSADAVMALAAGATGVDVAGLASGGVPALR